MPNDIKQAEAMYLNAASLAPQSAKVLNAYAKFLKNAKHDYDKAEVYYKRAISADPSYPGPQ